MVGKLAEKHLFDFGNADKDVQTLTSLNYKLTRLREQKGLLMPQTVLSSCRVVLKLREW